MQKSNIMCYQLEKCWICFCREQQLRILVWVPWIQTPWPGSWKHRQTLSLFKDPERSPWLVGERQGTEKKTGRTPLWVTFDLFWEPHFIPHSSPECWGFIGCSFACWHSHQWRLQWKIKGPWRNQWTKADLRGEKRLWLLQWRQRWSSDTGVRYQ